MITDPIKETTELVQQTTSSVQKLGPVTVAFFIVLAFLLFLGYTYTSKSEAQMTDIHGDVATVEKKIDDISADIDKAFARIAQATEDNNYVLRQTCRNTAKTETQKTACDIAPSTSRTQRTSPTDL